MCTLAVRLSPGSAYPLVVGSNRDEMKARAFRHPFLWEDAAIPFVAGRDEVAGGTWLGINAAGLFVGLTNLWTGRKPDEARASRGALVVDLLGASDLAEARERLGRWSAAQINPCIVVCADTRGEGWPSGLRDDRIARALALIHSRPAGAWTVDDLARHAGMSRSRFHRRFRELVGETPARYLVSWRMERAAALLGDERLSVAEVGQKVGYSAEDSFVRAFRRVHDCSPSQFRRHQLAG